MREQRQTEIAQAPWLVDLEQAHGLLHDAARQIEEQVEPSTHLAPAARSLERGAVALYDAFDGRTDRLTAVSLAHSRLWDAAVLCAHAGLASAIGPLRGACSSLVAAEEHLSGRSIPERPAEPFQAGVEIPRLHAVERPSLAPSFRAPKQPEPPAEPAPPPVELPEPRTFDELGLLAAEIRRRGVERARARQPLAAKPKGKLEPAATPPPGFAVIAPPRLEEDEFIARWARECFTEIGMLGVQRAPLRGDGWRECRSLDHRLVTALDALAALGPQALAGLEALAKDAPVADPMRVFAITMVGGCVDGRDGLGAAERVLHRFGAGDEEVAAAFVAAMKLVPNPFARQVLDTLLGAREGAERAIAAEVLEYRGWLGDEQLSRLATEPEPTVLAHALRGFAVARHPDGPRVLAFALEHADPQLRLAALDAMALGARADAASAARKAAAAADGEAALVRLALVADEDDARWLLERMRAAPSPATIEAVGWAGLIQAVPRLIELLEDNNATEEAKLAAGGALERLLGANLVATIDIEPERLDDPAVADPDPDPVPQRRSLAELVSDARDLPPEGSKEQLEVAAIEPGPWRAYWNEHRNRFEAEQRVRRGRPYAPSVSLYELTELSLGADDRRRLARELCARTGRFTHFDPHDFVYVQEQCLERWATLVAQAGDTPGSWGRAIRL